MTRMTRIAVVGMACRYPDADSPQQLWENVLAGRRAFRRFPDERMRMQDYWDADPAAPDRFYASNAAVLEGYSFDRVAHKIAGSTFRVTDMTHWLALDVAGQALQDAGFAGGDGLPRDRTGVVIGNTLTGEFVRANLMRLRWPYVRRTLAEALRSEEGWDDDRLAAFLADLETRYKSPFPPVDEDSLAGSLANTIAGRICNYYDLKGGGYTVDGACSSSLLSVVTGCKALLDEEIDVCVAGGVDLSLDPLEMVGFAKTGALARGEMRVYDRSANGFWPGEGCGMIVLMRETDARALRRRIYATVAGWGISSDGAGGITRPEVNGYRLALRRAYARAGFGIDTVPLFEGHGTGTPVGDTVELTALSNARTEANPGSAPAAVGTVKGMIGHTKAAAGVAGLIKTVMALSHQVLPPTVGCFDPHPVLTTVDSGLRALRSAERWPTGAPVRAGVTAMGFGGINTHIVLAGAEPRGEDLDARFRALTASAQDAELLVVDGADLPEVHGRLAELADWIGTVSYAQLGDAAATALRQLRDLPYRAAVVATSPEEARRRLAALLERLDAGEGPFVDAEGGLFYGEVTRPGRVGYLFPGQGSGLGTSGGALCRRFPGLADVYASAELPAGEDPTSTHVAQPRIVTGSLAGLRALADLGLRAEVAVGHSLGELSALHWAGVLDNAALLRIATHRGRAMAEHSASGTMAGINAGPETVTALVNDLPVVIASYNGPGQTVVAGPVDAIDAVGARAASAGLSWARLRVSHAFHSPLVAPAAEAFGGWLAGERFRPPTARVVSTVTGEPLRADADLHVLLRAQITDPVLFAQALSLAAKDVDLFVEVGPGRVLTGLAQRIGGPPTVALDTDDESLGSFLRVVGAAFVTGVPLDHEALLRDRFIRPLEIGAAFDFLANPCEQAPAASFLPDRTAAGAEDTGGGPTSGTAGESTLEVLRRLAAERVELPPELVADDCLLLDDLHMSSITVGQLMNQAALLVGAGPIAAPTNLATATLRELAETLDLLADGGGGTAPQIEGAATWVRAYRVDLVAEPVQPAAEQTGNGLWQVFGSTRHPLSESLRQALQTAGLGHGVLVCLAHDCAEADLAPALRGAQEAARSVTGGRFVLVQSGRGAAGLARTLRQEVPGLHVTIVHVPAGTVGPSAVDRIVAEVAATDGFSEAVHDATGGRSVPSLRPLPIRAERTRQPLGPGDVLLVTGGGKGITAECALALARDTGAALALVGRSDPAADADLAANLRRMADAGARLHYERADVTDPAQVGAAVAEIERVLGPVTGVLHGAGRNEPAALSNLDMEAFRRTLAPKIDGLQAVLEAVDSSRLRLLVTLGSIIGRAGLPGEGHYAVANEWLAALTEAVGERNPHCRCLCLEWSVWAGVGMGERLSVVESLTRDGITPIGLDQGVQILRRLVADPDLPPVVVIAGRTGTIDTIRRDTPPVALQRFTEQPVLHYAGAELVCEANLDPGTDLYLTDHALDGNLLFPAVFGMEAMAQVAAAVVGAETLPVFEDLRFLRPIVVPADGGLRIRTAATVVDDGVAEVSLRSADTGYGTDHFRARLRFAPAGSPSAVPAGPPDQVPEDLPPVALDPRTELYGSVLFQGARFHRLVRYHRAAARHVDADVELRAEEWFARFLPGTLLLGDPGLRDALMHGNQVCVPDATLLPVGVDRLYPAGPLAGHTELRYCATERSQDGDTYTYDVAVRTPDGRVVERWEGLRLQAVRRNGGAGPWVVPLLGPYLERTAEILTGGRVAVAVEPAGESDGEPPPRPADGDAERYTIWRRRQTGRTLARALGRTVQLVHRTDGRPEADNVPEGAVSAAHGPGLTLAVVADHGPAGCDVETVTPRSEGVWQGLLGAHHGLVALVAAGNGDDTHTAATRVWAAVESLRKAGLPPGAPLTVAEGARDGWVVFTSSALAIATFATTVRGRAEQVVFAILTQEGRS